MKILNEFLETVPETQRADVRALHDLIISTRPDLKPYLQPSGKSVILGFGKYHYVYDSGREGDWFRVGIGVRKAGLSLYVVDTQNGEYLPERYASKLGKVSVGKSCIRFKELADLNEKVVVAMLKEVSSKDLV